MNGAQALIESLRRENVTHMFGYAGATICPAVDALAAVPEIGYTLVRTEQNAGHMASGYARVSGKVGVCMVTSGPGATNLLTGIATAYMDSIPMVAITGQVPSNLLGRDIFQEVDITGAAAPFTKH
ncbi:MAG: acetolactate synthase, large subunit, biosynthetic type, partial [Oscillibacter sp.]|nr:acetolactate synthase, large subunit, biosynthetic type [Oscillibacter sp.]